MREDAATPEEQQMALRLARRLAQLRVQAARSLDELAEQTGLSRATLSRFERGESSPSAAQLSRLAIAYGLTASRVLADVEALPVRHLPLASQPQWRDAPSGFARRMVCPPLAGFATEVIAVELAAGSEVDYPEPVVAGMEHHLCLLQGRLALQVDAQGFDLRAGDSASWQSSGRTRFANPGQEPARYLLAMSTPR
ncbi:helix-turn-helix domain-containing protein [Inhella sp.]|uniref:helix-turn-helix domain-containing protein n=1 Tax=Inhella sp. TaxID=1921806 RepID=UPI0035B2F02E